MRILVLTKRQYTGRDLLDDRFGRLYELPEALSRRGHEVSGLTLSYRKRPPLGAGFRSPAGVKWNSVNSGFPLLHGLPRYLSELRRLVQADELDVVWASSDVYHAIVAGFCCHEFTVPLVIDLYDNYEHFAGARVPGVKSLFRSACRAADALTVVSHNLNEYVSHVYQVNCPSLVLSNAVDRQLFVTRPKREARVLFGLPQRARIIGTAGAINAQRGIGVLFEAFLALAARDPDLWLAYAGPRDRIPRRYRHDRIRDLGIVDWVRIPYLFSALDVAVICNVDSSFGRYCFPQKFYEIIACGTPLVAAGVGEMQRLLSSRSDCQFAPGSVEGLQRCLSAQLASPRPISHLPVPDWEDCAARFEEFLGEVPAVRRRECLG